MIITWLLRHYYIHYFYIIITYYYILSYYVLLQNHYYVLLHHYYTIITLLLHHYYFIITKGKSCNNDYIITCYAKGMHLLLHYYYVLLRHYYIGFYYYSLLSISVSRTCRCQSWRQERDNQPVVCQVSFHGQWCLLPSALCKELEKTFRDIWISDADILSFGDSLESEYVRTT